MRDSYLRSLNLMVSGYATLYLRIALAAAFLTSVTDRFGIWAPPGTKNLAWGDMTGFMAYAAKLNPWFPSGVFPVLAWIITVAETSLALALLLGFHTRISAQLSGWLPLVFAIGMTVGTGIKSALNASVFSASAGAFLLATSSEYPLTLDSIRRREKCGAALNTCVGSQAKNMCVTSPAPHSRHYGEVDGRQMSHLLPRIFFVHFGPTSSAIELRCMTSSAISGSIAFHSRMGFRIERSNGERHGVPWKINYGLKGADRVLFVRRVS